jgi:glycosyltransferase involved in cell wall biosynthesis/GNAT superfamily N-acetyltransferase
VLWLVKGLGPGGAEHLMVAAAAVHDRDRFRFDVEYLLPWKDALVAPLEALGVRTHCLGVKDERDLRWAARLRARLLRDPVDILHAQSPYPAGIARLVVRSLPKSARPRLVYTVHNTFPSFSAPTRILNGLTYPLDDADLAVSTEVHETIWPRLRARTEVVVHGVLLDEVRAQLAHRDDVRAELGIGAGEKVAGTIANFRRQKDYPNLLAAARRLLDRGWDGRIVAVGQGPLEAEMRALHERLGLGDRVLLLGHRADAVRVLAACDLFTMASDNEGLPVALMEALALGLPVACTAVGGIPEAVTDGVEGLLVPPQDPAALADAIEAITGDDDRRAAMAAAARAAGERFDIRHAVGRIEERYRELVPDPPTPPPPPPPAKPRPPRAALEIRRAEPDDRDEILALLARSLGREADPRYEQLFAWKHEENAFGPSPAWVATDGDRIAGFRVLMRWEFVDGERTVKAVRAVDTATHPDYQGQGIFTKLTLHGIEELRDDVAFVFNTPNDQSRPGYLKMGWEVVGKLPTAVRPTHLSGVPRILTARVPAERWTSPSTAGEDAAVVLADTRAIDELLASLPAPAGLRTRLSPEVLRWRYATPLLGYRAVVAPGGLREGVAIFRIRARGDAREAALSAVLARGDDRALVGRLTRAVARIADADYVIRIGGGRVAPGGMVQLPGQGPVLTWRAVGSPSPPARWDLSLGDIELF